MTSWLRQVFHRVRCFLLRARDDRELDAEMTAHLAFATEDNLQRGLPPSEARRQALVDFGGPQQAKEQHREARSLPFLESISQDLRFGFRMLRRSPGFSLLAILCLTLGIAANAEFSVGWKASCSALTLS